MSASLRPLTTGQLLDRTFQTYRQNFLLFAGISALPHAFLLVIQLSTLGMAGASAGIRTGHSFDPAAVARVALLAFVAGLVTLIVSVLASSIATAATVFGVSDIYLEKETSISSCFARVNGKIGKVIYASFELGFRVGLGFLLFIIPGIYWAGKYGLAVPAVVLEDIKGKQACARSAELTKDSVGRIVAIYFLTWILVVSIGALIVAVPGIAAISLKGTVGTAGFKVFRYVVSMVVNTIVTPVMSIALTLAYYDQRVRLEAFDIENMMSLLGEPGSSAPENTPENTMGATS
ncbi:MAG: glycerophosphoryl diester phosphodiesterase membrane domain-containing protein [Candidatus Korobacteraceae bacterium]